MSNQNQKRKLGDPVPGKGNLKAKIMIVGEAPGENEDIQGEPFVGKSGKLLDKWLAHIGLNRKDVYITNMVKIRPPNNRTPKAREIKEWAYELIREVTTIRPEVIITTGNVPTQYFLETNLGINQLHGKILTSTLFGANIFPIFHPAYILRNKSKESIVIKDLEVVADVLSKI